jgi:hypothetical protein
MPRDPRYGERSRTAAKTVSAPRTCVAERVLPVSDPSRVYPSVMGLLWERFSPDEVRDFNHGFDPGLSTLPVSIRDAVFDEVLPPMLLIIKALAAKESGGLVSGGGVETRANILTIWLVKMPLKSVF